MEILVVGMLAVLLLCRQCLVERTLYQDISAWDVSSVTIWQLCLSATFDQDLSNWCVTNISSLTK